MNGKRKRPAAKIPADLSSLEAVESFREAAAEFMKKATLQRIRNESAG